MNYSPRWLRRFFSSMLIGGQAIASIAKGKINKSDLIDQLISWIKANKVSKSSFEFQVLYGVPMQGRLEQLIDQGHRVRIYVPYGKDWFDYSVRRLKENPDIAGYVISNLFKK